MSERALERILKNVALALKCFVKCCHAYDISVEAGEAFVAKKKEN